MSTQYPHRIDRDTAERLLDGDVTAYRDEMDLLAGLLVAAAAPSRPHEVAGEQAALAAFRAAQLSATIRSPRQPTARRSAMKMFTIKAAVLATTAVGGVAAAATFGTFPDVLTDRAVPSVGPRTPTSAPHGTGTGDAAHPGTTGPTGSPSPTRSAPPGSPHALDPAAVGLCRAYVARSGGKGKGNDKVLDTRALAPLIALAGGRDNVPAYCQHLLAAVQASEPTRDPKGQDDGKAPAGKPSQPPGG